MPAGPAVFAAGPAAWPAAVHDLCDRQQTCVTVRMPESAGGSAAASLVDAGDSDDRDSTYLESRKKLYSDIDSNRTGKLRPRY